MVICYTVQKPYKATESIFFLWHHCRLINRSTYSLVKNSSLLHRKQRRTTPSCSIGKNVYWLWMFSESRDTHRLEHYNKMWKKVILSSTTSLITADCLQIIVKHFVYINSLAFLCSLPHSGKILKKKKTPNSLWVLTAFAILWLKYRVVSFPNIFCGTWWWEGMPSS